MKVNMEVVRRRKRVASDETDHHHPFLFRSSSTSRNAQAWFLTGGSNQEFDWLGPLQAAKGEACIALRARRGHG
jgi:hypothetical protein